MYRAIRGALTLAVLLVVLQIFLPEVCSGLVSIILKMIELTLNVLNQGLGSLPQ